MARKLDGRERLCLFTLAGYVARTVDGHCAASLSLEGLAERDGVGFKITARGQKLADRLRKEMVGDTGFEPVTPRV